MKNSSQKRKETPENPLAVWYFVSATFVFAAPTLFSVYDALPLRIASLVVGAVLMSFGFFALRKELTSADMNSHKNEVQDYDKSDD